MKAQSAAGRIDQLTAAIAELRLLRSIFHSEADLQHALAWQLQTLHPSGRIRLERPFGDKPRIHVDVYTEIDGRRTAIELKYWPAPIDLTITGERFHFRSNGAHDIARYDFLKDLVRVEKLIADGIADEGYVLAVTNDALFWKPGRRGTIDESFQIHDRRELCGEMKWAAHAGTGTTKQREATLALSGRYACTWRPFSEVEARKNREFRYLSITVGR